MFFLKSFIIQKVREDLFDGFLSQCRLKLADSRKLSTENDRQSLIVTDSLSSDGRLTVDAFPG